MESKPVIESEWWDLLQTQSMEAVEQKYKFDCTYTLVKNWLEECSGLKECIRLCAEYALQGGIPKGFMDGLNDMHPRALLLLSKYGVEFQPYVWEQKPPWGEPVPRSCFGNSFKQQYYFNRSSQERAWDARMSYVEGVGCGAPTDAVLHAWNGLHGKNDVAFDYTWYAVTGWAFYFGLHFNEYEYALLRTKAYPDGSFHLLFSHKAFPHIEELATRILQRREVRREKNVYKQIVRGDRDF